MPQRCKDCSAPLPQTWTGPMRHCPACGSVVRKEAATVSFSISDVKVEKKPAAKTTTTEKKKTSTSRKKK